MPGKKQGYEDRQRHHMTEDLYLHDLEEGYNTFRNPLFAWGVIRLCIENDEPLPPWVRTHLVKVAAELLDVDPAEAAGKGKAPLLIQKALGMSTRGRGTIFSRFRNEVTRLAVRRRVLHQTDPRPFMIQVERPADEQHQPKTRIHRELERWAEPYNKRVLKVTGFSPDFGKRSPRQKRIESAAEDYNKSVDTIEKWISPKRKPDPPK